MNHVEAVVVLALVLQNDAQANRMKSFLIQFPHYADLAKEMWLEMMGTPWTK